MVDTDNILETLDECSELEITDVLDWVCHHYNPDEVFNDEELKYWALDNGYAKL